MAFSTPFCHSTIESTQALLRRLQSEESSLLEQECTLKLRKALADASVNSEEGTAITSLWSVSTGHAE